MKEMVETIKLVDLRWDDQGLIPAIVQDAATGEVLMLAYMNREALERSISTGEAHFWSRSRSELWHKGATSGNTQRIVEIRYDCDGDALLLLVEPRGPACHTGEQSCFYRCLVKWQGPGTRDQEIRAQGIGFAVALIS